MRTKNPIIGYGLNYAHASTGGKQEPKTYSDTLSGPEKKQRLAAMAIEVNSPEA